MTTLTGTLLHLELLWKLERVRFALWPVGILGLLWAMGDSMRTLYPDQLARGTYARINAASPVIQAVNGPGHALDTAGGIVVFEVGGYLLVLIGIMATTLVVRGTRGEETSGRTEMTLAARTGSLAQLVAVLIFAVSASGLIGAGATGVLIALDLPVSGAIVYGAGLAMVGAFFAAVAAIAAQVAATPAGALGISGVSLAGAFTLRAVGDAGNGPWAWWSPLGWAQAAAPFATTGQVTERWWPVTVGVGASAVLVGCALAMRVRRELGASLIQPGAGPAGAGPLLRDPVTGTLRASRGVIAGWSVGALLMGAAFGGVGDEIDDVFAASPGIETLFGTDADGVADGYFTFALLLLGCAASGLGLSLVGRLRVDEHRGVAELVLATATSRARWLASGAAAAGLATTVVLLSAGLGLGGGYAMVSGESGEMARLLAAALLYLPAAWLLAALLIALLAYVPRAMGVGWAVFSLSAVISLLGGPLQLDPGVRDLSAFEHLPGLPLEDVGAGPLVISGVAASLCGAAALGVKRRDIGR